MLVSVQMAAQLLGVSVVTMRRWVRARKIDSVRLGRRVLIEERMILEVINTARRPRLEGGPQAAGQEHR